MKLSIPLILAAAVAGASASPSLADTNVAPPYLMISPNVSVWTPTMERRKLADAIALRAEAAQLLAADGGKLSPQHLTYVRTRIAVIRNGEASPPTGSLIARR